MSIGVGMEALDHEWKKTCKILLGDEVGDLNSFHDYLSSKCAFLPVDKQGLWVVPEYERGRNFIPYDKVGIAPKFEPLSINEVKDIDSIVNAIQERVVYVGNVTQGRCANVYASTNVVDSFNVYMSRDIQSSKNVAYSAFISSCENAFGISSTSITNFAIGSSFMGGDPNNRIFESVVVAGSSDIYFSATIMYCSDVMFSFGLRNKRYVIGNNQLSREKYAQIKNHLIEQIRHEFEDKRGIEGIYDLLSKPIRSEIEKIDESKLHALEPENKEAIDSAWRSASRILLNGELGPVDEYEHFLTKDLLDNIAESRSVASGRPVYYLPKLWNAHRYAHRIVNWDEVFILGDIIKADINTLADRDNLNPFVSFDAKERYVNSIKSVCPHNSQNVYACGDAADLKNAAYTIWSSKGNNLFGCFMAQASSFCINVYSSSKLVRGFECDACSSSSDIFFSHAVENSSNVMFSFGVRAGKYVIGNAQYSPDKYKQIKDSLVEQIYNELVERKDLRYSVYNMVV